MVGNQEESSMTQYDDEVAPGLRVKTGTVSTPAMGDWGIMATEGSNDDEDVPKQQEESGQLRDT